MSRKIPDSAANRLTNPVIEAVQNLAHTIYQVTEDFEDLRVSYKQAVTIVDVLEFYESMHLNAVSMLLDICEKRKVELVKRVKENKT